MADPCPLWCVLLKKFAMGKMSAVEVQEMAAAAVKSGANSAEMLELEALGSYGSKPGNCNRDMLRKCSSKPCRACALESKVLNALETGREPSCQEDRLLLATPSPVDP